MHPWMKHEYASFCVPIADCGNKEGNNSERKADSMSSNLELYVKNGCPWCHKVLSFMEANDIELPLHNLDESEADREHLIEVGGKRQVPCLLIDGKPLYESSDIIDYLKEHVVEGEAQEAAPAEEPAAAAGAHCTLDGHCSF